MEKPLSPRPGDLVIVRRSRWRVGDVRRFDGCALVTLHGAARLDDRAVRRVVAPFDAIEPVERIRRPRVVGARAWRRVGRAVLASEAPAGGLTAARCATIDLIPYQLEPALAVVNGAGTRFLLADEVGLGKTIQAALIAGELLARGSIDRLLVLTPPGLRDQWIEELSTRFGIQAARVDARMLGRTAAGLPLGVNPWTTVTVAVASIDYVKRPEVGPSVTAVPWDLVIDDEAASIAADS